MHGLPIRAIVAQGTRADSKEAGHLIEGLSAEYLLADKGYDTNAILEQAAKQAMTPVIPPKKNRKEQQDYDEDFYKLRHLVENTFLHLKRWRGIATPYAKKQHLSSLLYISEPSKYGQKSRDYII